MALLRLATPSMTTASWLLLKVCTFHIALIVVPIIGGIASVGDAINEYSVMVTVRATSWSTNDDITDAHISATIQQILTKFSAVVTYVK